MKYKRHKPHLKNTRKGIEYGSPKHYQALRLHNPNSAPSTKYKCKKLKGDHDFVFLRREKFFLWSFDEYRCRGCGKKKSVHSKF